MQSLDKQVMAQASEWITHHTLWLCTVLSTFGSSPRSPGTMMVINNAGQFCGSLSGGCVEDDFLERIALGQFNADSQRVIYGEAGLTPNKTLPCGGSIAILIERLKPGAESAAYLARMQAALAGAITLRKRLVLPLPCYLLEECDYASSTQVEDDEQTLTITLAAAPQLVIAGLSEVAVYCADFATALGFNTIVCETRSDMLQNYRHRLPPSVQLEEVFPAKWLEQHGQHQCSAVVALTHDPRMDDLTLMEAVLTPAFYIGAMGSQRTSEKRFERLKRIAGLTDDEMQRIHAPIGLPIGSKTPAEIALAVMSDVVKTKNQAMMRETGVPARIAVK
ncbi:XdhC family protein [Rouxiella chamberiensis]|uniref:XdhC family protein n=1 Tax=Rouxiella chamberiensis TaxID=1513468 RepID=A0ABY7HSK6_9GAMM|nr:XdhC family protein [Rouxiella chamberiensis]WAT02155.1 XdhC family protein [Rouxiella chamberiensis]